MVVAVPRPLVDIPPAFDSGGTSMEDKQIARLVSGNSFARGRASEWLKENGNSQTAFRLEGILLKGEIPKECRRDIGLVLQHLSWKHMEFGNSTNGRVTRMSALASAFSTRNSTPYRFRA